MRHSYFIGLGAMGINIASKLHSRCYPVTGYDLDPMKRKEAASLGISVIDSYDDVTKSNSPSNFLIMVSHVLADGTKPVDLVLDQIRYHVIEEDVICDLGNSQYEDTVRRAGAFSHYMGVGVSGGIEGAKHGSCMMVGGNQRTYNETKPLLDDIACDGGLIHVAEDPGSGHDVKLAHNLIEYAQLQSLGEAIAFCRTFGYQAQEVVEYFQSAAINTYLQDLTINTHSQTMKIYPRYQISQAKVIGFIKEALRHRIPIQTIGLAWVQSQMVQGPMVQSHRVQCQSLTAIDFSPLEMAHDALYLAWTKELEEGLAILHAAPYAMLVSLPEIINNWQHGSILAKYFDIAHRVVRDDDDLDGIDDVVLGGDFGSWAIQTGMSRGVTLPITSSVLYNRWRSTQKRFWPDAFVAKARGVFGNHEIKHRQE